MSNLHVLQATKSAARDAILGGVPKVTIAPRNKSTSSANGDYSAASLRVATRTAFAALDPSLIEKRGSVCAIVLQICNVAVSVVTLPARFAFRPSNFLTR